MTAALSSPAAVRLSDGASAIGSTAQRLWIDDGGSSVSVDDNGGSLTVDGTVALGAGSAAIGRVDIGSSLPAGSNNIGDVDVLTLPSLPAGSNAIGKLAANSGVDIGDVDVTSIAAGSNTIGNVGVVPRTSGGLTAYSNNDLDETDVTVKASAGQLYGWYIYNDASAKVFVHFYDALIASVTVGSTRPLFTLTIPANTGANVLWPSRRRVRDRHYGRRHDRRRRDRRPGNQSGRLLLLLRLGGPPWLFNLVTV